MKMIRWSGLIVFIVIVGLITIFTLFFLDGIIKGMIEDRASLAVGAKVEIGDLRFKIFGLSVDIQNLQVANPEEPMRNSVEVGSLGFDLGAAPLLKKKIVIERMKVLDLAWNTPRKTSGALPPRLQKKLEARKKPSDLGAKAEKRIEECVLPNFSILADLKKRSPEELLKGANLQSAAFLGDYPKKVSNVKETWEKRLKELPAKDEIEKDVKAFQSLKDKRPRDLTQLPAYLEKVNDLQKKISDTQKTLTTAQQEFKTEMNNLKTSLQEVEKLKDADVKTVMGKLGVQIPSATDLICVLLGKEVAHKVNWALGMYRKLSQYTSKGKPKEEKEKPKPVPRMKGMDVRFPITRGYPDFLLELAEFSARPDIKKASGIFAFERLAGELRGLTSHPALYGKPTLFKLNGSMVGNLAKDFALAGQFDHRKTLAEDRIDLSVKELRVEQTGTPGPQEFAPPTSLSPSQCEWFTRCKRGGTGWSCPSRRSQSQSVGGIFSSHPGRPLQEYGVLRYLALHWWNPRSTLHRPLLLSHKSPDLWTGEPGAERDERITRWNKKCHLLPSGQGSHNQ